MAYILLFSAKVELSQCSVTIYSTVAYGDSMIDQYNVHETLVQAANGQSPLIKFLRQHFDADFYLQAYPDATARDIEPFLHYIIWGFEDYRLPNPNANIIRQLMSNPEVASNCGFPYRTYVNNDYSNDQAATYNIYIKFHAAFYERMIVHRMQDIHFPIKCETAKKIMVVVVPEIPFMGGGVYSLFSIANTMHYLRHTHDYEIMVMTRPNFICQTYFRQSNFRNAENVFRFEQIIRCTSAETVYIHIPEVHASTFIESLHADIHEYLKSRPNLFINIANQNIQLMPPKEAFEDLRSLATELTQSIAHHSCFTQECADQYNLPSLLLPAYVDVSNYPASGFADKEDLIIYSPDFAPYKEAALKKIKDELPNYRLVEIAGMTFDQFMEYATRCRFTISFGEGYDGYLMPPITQGGSGFAVYNTQFYPEPAMKDFYNIFSTGEDMVEHIVEKIRELEHNQSLCEDLQKKIVAIADRFYNKPDYVKRIGTLIQRQFELFPTKSF